MLSTKSSPQLISQDHVQLRYYTQVEARNRRGKFQQGRKVTGLMWLPPGALRPKNSREETLSLPAQLLVSTNDNRMRLFQMETFSQLCKFKGLANESLQLAGSFSSDGKYVISASETGHVYVWNTTNVYRTAIEQSGEHGVYVRGSGRMPPMWRKRHDRNLAYESFLASHDELGNDLFASFRRTDSRKTIQEGDEEEESSISSTVDVESVGGESVGNDGDGSEPSVGSGVEGKKKSLRRKSTKRAMPCISTAAVFAPFPTVSLAAAASEVHMLYTDLEQLANSIIVAADYTGKIRFYMRASASSDMAANM